MINELEIGAKAPKMELKFSDRVHFYRYFQRALHNSEALLFAIKGRIEFYEAAFKERLENASEIIWKDKSVTQVDVAYKNRVLEKIELIKKLSIREIITLPHLEKSEFGFYQLWTSTFMIDLIDMLRLYCEYDQLEAKVEMQKVNMEVWDQRVEMYRPIFEKDAAEANEHWDSIWEKAVKHSEKNTVVAIILRDYPKDLQSNPETFNQDLKNETYKALVAQINFDKDKSKLRKV